MIHSLTHGQCSPSTALLMWSYFSDLISLYRTYIEAFESNQQSTTDWIRTWAAFIVSDFLTLQMFLFFGARILQSLLIWVIFLSAESWWKPRFHNALTGQIMLVPIWILGSLTLSNCQHVPVSMNLVLSSFSLRRFLLIHFCILLCSFLGCKCMKIG